MRRVSSPIAAIAQRGVCASTRNPAGTAVTKPDLAPFRALMGPAYDKISAYAGADNVAKMRAIVDKVRQS